jgi:hypothetical protein
LQPGFNSGMIIGQSGGIGRRARLKIVFLRE